MSPSTRESLIAAATALLDAGGPEGVTLREVGRLTGVSHNAPYKHFADKQSLLAAVAARELTSYAALLAGEGDLAATMRGYVGRALRHPARFRLVYGPWTVDSIELARAAEEAWVALLAMVRAAQEAHDLHRGTSRPPGESHSLRRAWGDRACARRAPREGRRVDDARASRGRLRRAVAGGFNRRGLGSAPTFRRATLPSRWQAYRRCRAT